jgi:opacity protein-like surface antigen
MKRIALFAVLAFCFAVPALMAQAGAVPSGDHVEVGAFADYFRLSQVDPSINFVGLGGRVGFNVRPNVALEAEMAYDFKRNFTTVFNNGVTTTFTTTRFRPLTGLFGPKFQAGGSGPLRVFVTGKVGFVNFSSTTEGPLTGFTNQLGAITAGDTRFALYPGGGVEGFWGPFGLRLDVGDEIYFDNGARNNLKVTFGPAIRF